MKNLRYAVAICMMTAPLVSCGSGPPSYEQNIHSALSGIGHVNIRFLSPSVVLLTGRVEDAYTLNAIKRAAWDNDEVEEVISQIYVIN